MIAVVILTWMVFWMRKVSRNVKVQLEQAVDSALQRGNHHGLGAGDDGLFAVEGKGWSRSFSCWRHFNKMSGSGRRWVQCSVLLLPWCSASCSTGAVFASILVHFFKWTSLFILFVAAGLAAGAIRAFHEAGLWNHFQEIAFDMSAVLSTHSLFGTLMEGILAIRKHRASAKSPSGLFISSRRWWHLPCHHAQGRQRLPA